MTKREEIIRDLKVIRTWAACSAIQINDMGKIVDTIDGALALIEGLWHEVDKVRSCAACKNVDKCDPNDDGVKQRFWVACGGSRKLKWEWRGVDGQG